MVELPWGLRPLDGGPRAVNVVRSEGRRFPTPRILVPASEFRHRSGAKNFSFSLADGDWFYFEVPQQGSTSSRLRSAFGRLEGVLRRGDEDALRDVWRTRGLRFTIARPSKVGHKEDVVTAPNLSAAVLARDRLARSARPDARPRPIPQRSETNSRFQRFGRRLTIKVSAVSKASPDEIHGDNPAAAAASAFPDRKELSAVAFERTRMPMVIADARKSDIPIVLANKAFLDLTGYTSEEVLGRNCRFLQGEGTSPAAIAEVRLAVAERREASVEILNYRKDGRPFWNQLHISPIEDDAGEVAYFFASQIDVTEFRKVQALEASEHRLLMEVDHRAKNVLAVVDSVVRLSRADDPARYAASVQQRVQALSVAHTLLAEKGWKPVELREVVARQVDRFKTTRVEVRGLAVLIAAETVQPLALVIHELATNAAVHGALARPDGRVRVSWEAVGTQGGFRMVWRETGSSKPRPDSPPGFGSVMVKAMVEKQLGGSLQRHWQADGVEIALELPGARNDSPLSDL